MVLTKALVNIDIISFHQGSSLPLYHLIQAVMDKHILLLDKIKIFQKIKSDPHHSLYYHSSDIKVLLKLFSSSLSSHSGSHG